MFLYFFEATVAKDGLPRILVSKLITATRPLQIQGAKLPATRARFINRKDMVVDIKVLVKNYDSDELFLCFAKAIDLIL